jgi:hypothetical protein
MLVEACACGEGACCRCGPLTAGGEISTLRCGERRLAVMAKDFPFVGEQKG